MPKFTVTVTRVSYASVDIEVEAEDKVKAEDIAHDLARNMELSEYHAEYETECIVENE